jgi:uncharacterized protein YndB with AHSA1/START domain
MGDDSGTERLLGTKLIAAGEARMAVLRRIYPVSLDDLWGAITEPARLRGWFTEPKGQLRLGGTFALEGSGHGRILRCDAPRMLRVTWSSGPGHPDEVEVRLSKAEEGGTLLELEHATVAATAPDGGTDPIVALGVGWELAMTSLDRYLREEAPVRPTGEDQALVAEGARAWDELINPGE